MKNNINRVPAFLGRYLGNLWIPALPTERVSMWSVFYIELYLIWQYANSLFCMHI